MNAGRLAPAAALGTLALAGALLTPALGADGSTNGRAVRASVTDIYSSCPGQQNAAETGSPAGREFEPYVAIDPTDPSHIVGAWQQDSFDWGGSKGIAVGSSSDGGRSFTEIPSAFACVDPDPDHSRWVDVELGFGPGTASDPRAGATLYSVALRGAFGEGGVAVATSADSGVSWENRQLFHNRLDPCVPVGFPPPSPGHICGDMVPCLYQCGFVVPGPGDGSDQPRLVADPVTPGTAYVVWDMYRTERLGDFPMFTRTTDFGRTWSEPRPLLNALPEDNGNANPTDTSDAHGALALGDTALANRLLIDPRSGTLYDVFDVQRFHATEPDAYTDPDNGHSLSHLEFMKSTDGGLTWTVPKAIALFETTCEYGHEDRCGGVFPAGNEPEAAIDPATGQLYVVWEDSRFVDGAYDEIVMSTSTDGGTTWTDPVRVSTPSGHPAFTPMVAVAGDGHVAVGYYDLRFDQPGDDAITGSVWVKISPPGGSDFGKDVSLAKPFDYSTGPQHGDCCGITGYTEGEYFGLAGGPNFFDVMFGTTTGDPSDPTDIWNVTVPSSKRG